MPTLAGKVAVITGGTRGIGLATARRLGREGAAVAITSPSDERLSAAVRDLEDAGVAATPLRADVRNFEEMQEVCALAASKLGGIDVLINNAGVGVYRPVADLTPEEWNLMFDTNVTGMFNATRAALPHLRARGGGWIINISSLSGTNPFANGAAYCATKAAVNAFSEALMQEVRHDGIRVSYVAPGSVDTTFGGGGREKRAWALQPDDVAQVISDLLGYPGRSLPSRVEIRPSQPPRKA